eukprot:jgi/Galph1/3050/GphlegSOOS_G1755.1
MFGLCVPSCPVFTQFEQVQPEKFVAQFPARLVESSVLFFLLPGASLPPGQVASLYWSLPPYENWLFAGLIANEFPSKLFTMKLPNTVTNDTMVEFGISVEPMSPTAVATHANPTIVLDQSDLQYLVRGIATDFFRFVESFGQSMGPEGLALIDKWFQKFQEKLRSDPLYWQRISERN